MVVMVKKRKKKVTQKLQEWTLKREMEKYQIITPKTTKKHLKRRSDSKPVSQGVKRGGEGMGVNTKDW